MLEETTTKKNRKVKRFQIYHSTTKFACSAQKESKRKSQGSVISSRNQAKMFIVILAVVLSLWWLVSKGKIPMVWADPGHLSVKLSNLVSDAPHPPVNPTANPAINPVVDNAEASSPEQPPSWHSFDYPSIRGSLRLILHNTPENPIGNLNTGSHLIPELCWKRGDEWLCALNLTTRNACTFWLQRVLGHLSNDSDETRFKVTMLIPSIFFNRLFPPDACLTRLFSQSLFRCEVSNIRPPASDFGEHRLSMTGDRMGIYNAICHTFFQLKGLEGFTDGDELIIYD